MNVCLEKLSESHAHTSFKWRNDPDVWTFTFNRPDREIQLEDELNWIRKVINNPNDSRFAIIADNQYVGNIYLTNIKDNTSFYGIFIGERSVWGKGIGKKATELILTHAKLELGLHTVFLRVKKENQAAVKLYTGMGFTTMEEAQDHFLMELDLNNFNIS